MQFGGVNVIWQMAVGTIIFLYSEGAGGLLRGFWITIAFLDQKESADWVFAQQMGVGTNTIKLIWYYGFTKLLMDNKFFHVEFLNSIF